MTSGKEVALRKVQSEIEAGLIPQYPCGICSPPKYGHYYGYCDDCEVYNIYTKNQKTACLHCQTERAH